MKLWKRTALLAAAVLAGNMVVLAHGTTPALAAGNACSNPVLAQDLSGWGSLDGAAVSRDTVGDLAGASYAFDTAGHQFYQPRLSVSAGQTWTVSAEDRLLGASGDTRMAVDWYDASGGYLNSQSGETVTLPMSTLSGGTWTEVSATFTAPAGAATAHILQVGDFTGSGTAFKATECRYKSEAGNPSHSRQAAARYKWGTDNPSQSDEYNAITVDLTQWGLFGADPGQRTGCSPGYQGHGQRCASQVSEANGLLTVTATADGVTGGLYSTHGGFRYGRIEERERAIPTAANGGAAYHAVPLLFPTQDNDYMNAEIDFAERDVASPITQLFVHHDDGQSPPCSVRINSTHFHNYAVDWEPNSVTWYVDGAQVCTVAASINYFDHLNGGAQLDMFPNTGTLMRPAREDVDWIRMYPVSATTYQP